MRLLCLSVCVRSDMVYVTCMQLLVAWFVLLLNAALLVVSDGAGVVYWWLMRVLVSGLAPTVLA